MMKRFARRAIARHSWPLSVEFGSAASASSRGAQKRSRIFLPCPGQEDVATRWAGGVNEHGGGHRVEGETVLQRPYIVRAPSGIAPYAILDQFKGPGTVSLLNDAIKRAVAGDPHLIEAAYRFLGVPEERLAAVISIFGGNPERFTWAAREAATADILRQNGYDGFVSYWNRSYFGGPTDGPWHLQEVFDAREAINPGTAGEFGVRPEFPDRNTGSPPSGRNIPATGGEADATGAGDVAAPNARRPGDATAPGALGTAGAVDQPGTDTLGPVNRVPAAAANPTDYGYGPGQTRPRVAPEDCFSPPQTRSERLAALGSRANSELLNAAGGAFSANVMSGDLFPSENDQRTPQERARDALIHGAVGAAAAVGLRHGILAIARRAGREIPQAEGALATFGASPHYRPPAPARVAAEEANGARRGEMLNRSVTAPRSGVPVRAMAATAATDDSAGLRWPEDVLSDGLCRDGHLTG
jgi:hypothetical protein